MSGGTRQTSDIWQEMWRDGRKYTIPHIKRERIGCILIRLEHFILQTTGEIPSSILSLFITADHDLMIRALQRARRREN